MLNVTVFCSDERHPTWERLKAWCGHSGRVLTSSSEIVLGGDLLLLVSCSEIMAADVRSKFGKVLVIHESDLPAGRGWSPLAWQILEGKNEITVSLLEAENSVDSGAVWKKELLTFQGHELSDEINEIRWAAVSRLMDYAVEHFDDARPQPQSGTPTYYRRRTLEDSRIDPALSIAQQFDLLRICEPRFPAFFDLRGHRYEITIKKVG